MALATPGVRREESMALPSEEKRFAFVVAAVVALGFEAMVACSPDEASSRSSHRTGGDGGGGGAGAGATSTATTGSAMSVGATSSNATGTSTTAGTGGDGPCGPETCGGCCDPAGSCQLGNDDGACGFLGEACVSCAAVGDACR